MSVQLRLATRSVERPARALVGDGALRDYRTSVDEDMPDADRVVVRILERGFVLNGCRIEQHEIGKHAGTDQTAIGNADPNGGLRSHLAHGVFQRQEFLITHIVSEYARKGPPCA